jgi:predicted RNA-binding protein YlxR (DUF448 family)
VGRSAERRPAPERSCVVCRARRPKRSLVRLARTADGRLAPDPTGKGPGRGAYLCRRRACWLHKDLERQLARALKGGLTGDDLAALAAFAEGLEDAGEDG